jgi:hypothetical protein
MWTGEDELCGVIQRLVAGAQRAACCRRHRRGRPVMQTTVDGREQRRGGEEKRRTRLKWGSGGMKWGLGFRRGGAAAAAAGYIPHSQRPDPTAGRRPSNGRMGGRLGVIGVPPPIGSCLGPARRAEVAAEALKGRRAGPAIGTIDRASGRVRVVLFRAVPRGVNRAQPIWNTIVWRLLHQFVA